MEVIARMQDGFVLDTMPRGHEDWPGWPGLFGCYRSTHTDAGQHRNYRCAVP
jgi:hypothetical protein